MNLFNYNLFNYNIFEIYAICWIVLIINITMMLSIAFYEDDIRRKDFTNSALLMILKIWTGITMLWIVGLLAFGLIIIIEYFYA